MKKSIWSKLHEFTREEFNACGYNYVAYYKDERVYSAVKNTLSKSGLPVLYIIAIPRENIVSVSCEVTLRNLGDILELHEELTRILTKPKKTMKK